MPPKGDFITLTGYYSTLLHELTHWTGLFSRLKRNIYGGKYNMLTNTSKEFEIVERKGYDVVRVV